METGKLLTQIFNSRILLLRLQEYSNEKRKGKLVVKQKTFCTVKFSI